MVKQWKIQNLMLGLYYQKSNQVCSSEATGTDLNPLFYFSGTTVKAVAMAIPNKICPQAKVSASKVNRDLMQMSCHCVHESAPFIQLPSSQ